MRYTKAGLLHGVVIVATIACSPAAAQDARRTYDLPAQELRYALRAVARSASQQLIADSKALRGKQSRALKGEYSLQEALDELLSGTDLSVEIRGGTVFVRGRSEPSRDAVANATDGEDILITGSRIRGETPSSPVITVSQADIRRAGQNDVGEVLRALPQAFSGGQNPTVAPGAVGNANQNLTGGSTPNLRGLGADATLSLLNGHRLSYGSSFQGVDVSSIPIAAIDRIEVITDGASAIYGSDAVGGVVNVVLKRDYSGLTTSARVGGTTDGGGEEVQLNATGGLRWAGGGILVSYDFLKADGIEARQRDYTQYMPGNASLVAPRRQNSFVLAGHQNITDDLEFSFDGLYNHRRLDSSLPTTNPQTGYFTTTIDKSFAVAPSLKLSLSSNWQVSLSGMYAEDNGTFDQLTKTNGSTTARSFGCYCNVAKGVELAGEGKLFALAGGDARIAIGGGYRFNSFNYVSYISGASTARGSNESRYAFGEVNIPLVSPSQDLSWANRLTANAAVRYENYVGSSEVVTPKVGFVYSPIKGIDLKASWGKSFKVPTLFELYTSRFLFLRAASAYGGTSFPSGSTALYTTGGNPQLNPEKATSWSLSAAVDPELLPGLHVELTYFNVRYKGRVVQPLSGANALIALSNPIFADYVKYSPTPAEQSALIATPGMQFFNFTGAPYNPATVVAALTNVNINGTSQDIDGFDLQARYRFSLGRAGHIDLHGNASWLRSKQQLNASSPTLQLAGSIFNPAEFKARGGASWSVDDFELSGFVNRIGSLRDIRSITPLRIPGQTTLDLAARYKLSPSSILGDLEIALTARNIFNAKPPYVAPSGGLNYYVSYDSTNYSAIGRFVSLAITKSW